MINLFKPPNLANHRDNIKTQITIKVSVFHVMIGCKS